MSSMYTAMFNEQQATTHMEIYDANYIITGNTKHTQLHTRTAGLKTKQQSDTVHFLTIC